MKKEELVSGPIKIGRSKYRLNYKDGNILKFIYCENKKEALETKKDLEVKLLTDKKPKDKMKIEVRDIPKF